MKLDTLLLLQKLPVDFNDLSDGLLFVFFLVIIAQLLSVLEWHEVFECFKGEFGRPIRPFTDFADNGGLFLQLV